MEFFANLNYRVSLCVALFQWPQPGDDRRAGERDIARNFRFPVFIGRDRGARAAERLGGFDLGYSQADPPSYE